MQNNSYKKKPLWQWIVIYVVIAAILYGLVYYFFFMKKNTYTQTNTQVYQQTQSENNSNSPTTSINTPNNTSILNNTYILIKNFKFSPNTVTIHKGDSVTWTNDDSMSHTVTGDTSGPASSAISSGSAYSYTFTKTGTFPYHCSIHPSMKATIVVTE